jgi:hypothetical protein
MDIHIARSTKGIAAVDIMFIYDILLQESLYRYTHRAIFVDISVDGRISG